jgi:hypothetical protein
MATLSGVGISHHRHPDRAAQEAVQKALIAAGITQPDFVFLFCSLGYDPAALLAAVGQATGHCPLAGCSGQGVIVQGEGDESSFSVAVMVIQSDLRFHPQRVSRQDQSFEQVGAALGRQLQPLIAADAIALFLFTDGLTLNFDRLNAGLQSALTLTQPLPILGGAAGSDGEMQTTYQFCNDQVLTDGTVAVLMSGQGQVVWAVNHSCVPIGKEYKITRCEGNLIYELDHQPVFDILRQYLSDAEIERWDSTIVTFCFGLKSPLQEELTIRYLPRKDEALGTVMLQSEVIEGSSIWVMRRDQEKISQGITDIAKLLQDQLQGQVPALIFQFDCYGRGKSIFANQQKQQLLGKLQQALQPKAVPALPWIGFYSHGEIAPLTERRSDAGQPPNGVPQNAFHNYTLVLAAIY